MKLPVIAIFDIGKTNKKLFLFNERYEPVWEETVSIPETRDEDGFACEDLEVLRDWLLNSFARLQKDGRFEIRAINFSAYGASLVYLDETRKPITPLYNYLKPFPGYLQEQFNHKYGNPDTISCETASPVLGNLNSGMQLFRLKYEKPEIFSKVRYVLHLPQYLSFIFSGSLHSDYTSVGCHTRIWNFEKGDYHQWVTEEGLAEKLQPFREYDKITGIYKGSAVGPGLHDSSSALIPYIESISEPFILLSTGTWCISLNPFNSALLTKRELQQDCLCYLSHRGHAVKASRLFAGRQHDNELRRIAAFFEKPDDYYKSVSYQDQIELLKTPFPPLRDIGQPLESSFFSERALNGFENFENAYHQLMADLATEQAAAIALIEGSGAVKRIYVEGGFATNGIYIAMLKKALPHFEVIPASVPHAAAIGAAWTIREAWNSSSPGTMLKTSRV